MASIQSWSLVLVDHIIAKPEDDDDEPLYNSLYIMYNCQASK